MDIYIGAASRCFLDFECINQNACMIVDMRLQGMSGLELQHELRARGIDISVIFILNLYNAKVRLCSKIHC